MSVETITEFRCNQPGCVVVWRHYRAVPITLVRAWQGRKQPDAHFCSHEHLARWAAAEAAREGKARA